MKHRFVGRLCRCRGGIRSDLKLYCRGSRGILGLIFPSAAWAAAVSSEAPASASGVASKRSGFSAWKAAPSAVVMIVPGNEGVPCSAARSGECSCHIQEKALETRFMQKDDHALPDSTVSIIAAAMGCRQDGTRESA
jgi:hypothetical protein